MIKNLSFANTSYLWPVLGGAVLLLLIFIWKERKSPQNNRFWLKITAIFLAIISLALIALKPQTTQIAQLGTGIILTENYKPKTLDSLKKLHKRAAILNYTAGKSLHNALDSLSTIYVLGNGLKPFDLRQLDSVSANYVGGKNLNGITKLQYKQQNRVGDELLVNAFYEQPGNGNKIILQGPGGADLDSVNLSQGDSQILRLKSQLKAKGNFVYSIVEKDSLGKVQTTDPLPVQVNEKEKLRILIVNGFPTFETKYLKNFLAEAQNEVTVRSQVTKGKFVFENYNTASKNISALSERNLEDFDLLIIDANSLKSLSKSQKSGLEEAITGQGLGVFIQPDTDFYRFQGDFSDFTFSQDGNEIVNLDLAKRLTMNKYPFQITSQFGLEPIQKSGNEIISAYKQYGLGRIATTVLSNTYQLVLEGDEEQYKKLWSETITAVGKKKQSSAEWEVSYFGVQNEPFNFRLRTKISEPRVYIRNGYDIALRQDVDVSSLWRGTMYPHKTGWNSLVMQQDSTQVAHLFVTDSVKWHAMFARQTIHANKTYVSKRKNMDLQGQSKQPVNPLWFYLLFIFGMGFLWLEPKL
tara:strand:- start:38660 stop:40402 length:1743 start_codon:yes stop_codon:yes gene_type:complete